MSEWIGNKEVGLSKGQTAGDVGGTYVTRPEGYGTGSVFIVDTPEQAALKKQILESKTATHTSTEEYGRQVRYLQAIGRPVTPQGEIYVKPNMTPGQLHLLEDMPRASGAAPVRMRQDYYPSFTPYAPGRTEPQLPYTPIEKETPAGYGYATYPLYERAAGVSNWLQGSIERGVESLPIPSQAKQFTSGFYSFFTGLPAWGASGLVGWEAVARTEDKTKVPSMFAGGVGLMGSSIAQQARTEPYKLAGFGLGMLLAPRVMKVPKVNIKGTAVKMFGKGSPRISVMDTTPKTPIVNKMFGVSVKSASKGVTIESITPSYKKLFGERQTPTTGARISSIKSDLTPSFRKVFGYRQGRITGDTYAGIKTAITPTKTKLFGTGRIIPKSAKSPQILTTWHLKPTPEYIQGKFMEMNVFRGGNIKELATSLKRSPTAPKFPKQILIRGYKKLPAQISPSKPFKGITIIEKKTLPTATREIRMKGGMVQLQKVVLKPAQKVKVITIQKPVSKVLTWRNILKATAGTSMFRMRQKAVQITRQKASLKTRAVLMPALKLSPMVASVAIPKAAASTRTSALTITSPLSIQRSRTLTESIQRARQITRQRTDLMMELRKPTKLKFTDPFSRKRKKSRRGFGRFPELARVAAPSRLLKGAFKL